MKKLVGVVGTMVLCSTTAFADPDPTRQPMDRAIEQIGENIAEHPDNRGLQNALDHLRTNRERQATRGKNRAPGQQLESGNSENKEKTYAGVERAQLSDRVERADRPDRADRLDRPDRPDRPGSSKH
ncbi:MAG TPA: hypothetical protein VEL80_04405 [Burkholderiales bacterium]|nr:hypothetical protein [Burkholderiales bacterium]